MPVVPVLARTELGLDSAGFAIAAALRVPDSSGALGTVFRSRARGPVNRGSSRPDRVH